MDGRSRAIAAAHDSYGDPTTVVSAPGRVNLIGEHTDHQEGFVLPMALEHRTWIAFRPTDNRTVSVRADDLDKATHFRLDSLQQRPRQWSNYLIGVAHAMLESGVEVQGWLGAIAGDVPRGAALSSSAALEVAATQAFLADPADWDPTRMAQISQRAENEWVGVSSGIMDQLVSAKAIAGAALFIDCRSLETEAISLAEDADVVIMDTATRRGLLGSEYNDRRSACERAARAAGATLLRDVTMDDLIRVEDELTEVDFRRARHVVTENDRVLAAVEAAQDPERLGQLMNASHESMAFDFEISTEELDAMVELATGHAGCYGARMTGGGFGGAAVALVDSSHTEALIASVAAGYEERTGLVPSVFASPPSAGAYREDLT